MLPCELRRKIRENVLVALYKATGKRYVPAAISNRHVHLSRLEVDILFGNGYELKPDRPLVQPGIFAAKETVTLIGPKGRMEGVRILGPLREAAQVEISVTDSYQLGVGQVLRMSGDVAGSQSIVLETRQGRMELTEGVIIAVRHLHMSADQAKAFGLSDGQTVSLKSDGERSVTLNEVAVRTGSAHDLEVHLDTDEANAAMIKNGDLLEIVER